MFYVYILFSPIKDKYYIGQTQDIQERIKTHNLRKNLGANDWQLKYFEEFESRSEAMARETEIKNKKRRSYLEQLISSPDSYREARASRSFVREGHRFDSGILHLRPS